MERSGLTDDGLFQQVLGLDELALILQAVGRAERGAAGLCAAERVCRGWRDALRSAEGLAAWRWAAAGTELRRLWATPAGARAAAPPVADAEGGVNVALRRLKEAVRCTAVLHELGGLPSALQADSDGDVELVQEASFQLHEAADVEGDRAIRSSTPFPPAARFVADGAGEAAVPELDEYWAASRREPQHLSSTIVQPRAEGDGLHFASLECLYYEVSLEKRPGPAEPDECLAIGFGTGRFPLRGSQPGWKRYSVGYHSDDGHYFSGSGIGRSYGPRFGDGDTVGCGVCLLTRSVFFTKNGEFLGVAEHDWVGDRPLYAIVGVGSHTRCTMHFGRCGDRPFAFDPESWPAERAKALAYTGAARSPPRRGPNRLPRGLEALEQLRDDHPVIGAMIHMLQRLGLGLEADEDDDGPADEDALALAARRSRVVRQLLMHLGEVRGGEFVLHGTDSEEEDEDDDEDEGWETDDDAVDGAEWADEEDGGGPPRPPVGGARQRAVDLAQAEADAAEVFAGLEPEPEPEEDGGDDDL